MNNDFENEKLINSLHWHFLSKNFALKKLLSFVHPMTAEGADEMAHYYSQYFVSLMSAMDMLYNDTYKYWEDFRKDLAAEFIFDGFSNGLDNYGYLWELRNSIIHRGLVLANQAVYFEENLPQIVAPATVESKLTKKGSRQYSAFGKYLLEIIKKCESKFGALIANHLQKNGLLNGTPTKEELLQAAITFLNNSGVPDFVKKQGAAHLEQIDLVAIQKSKMQEMVKLIGTDYFTA